VVVMGASAGGIQAVIEVLSRVPADLPAFLGVVIHRGASSTGSWGPVLGQKSKLKVVEPADGDTLTNGDACVRPRPRSRSRRAASRRDWQRAGVVGAGAVSALRSPSPLGVCCLGQPRLDVIRAGAIGRHVDGG
jgi:hypothetical protein